MAIPLDLPNQSAVMCPQDWSRKVPSQEMGGEKHIKRLVSFKHIVILATLTCPLQFMWKMGDENRLERFLFLNVL